MSHRSGRYLVGILTIAILAVMTSLAGSCGRQQSGTATQSRYEIANHPRWFEQVPYQPDGTSPDNPQEGGAWSAPQYVGMQAVHAALLPDESNGDGHPQGYKVILVSGSSNRDPMGEILGGISGGIDNRPVSVINNAGIWRADVSSPEGFRFERINPSPYQKQDYPVLGEPIPGGVPSPTNSASPPTNNSEIDLFCAGHVHLPNGNLFFAGGTKTYEDNFRGARIGWIYDWRRDEFVNIKDIINADTEEFRRGSYEVLVQYDPFSQTAQFERYSQAFEHGRWYPTVVQLTNGNVAVLGGLVHDDYQVVSSKVEVYDWRTNRVLSADFVPGLDGDLGVFYNEAVRDPETNASTVWAIYPRAHLMPNGDVFLSGDASGYGNRAGRETVWLSISSQEDELRLSFRPGPQRREANRYYSAVVHDPRYVPGAESSPGRGGLLHIGGQIGLDALANGPVEDEYRNGIRSVGVKASMSYFDYDPASPTSGSYSDFGGWLGQEKTRAPSNQSPNMVSLLDDSRINHLSVLLPTRQVLVVGGGNYGYRLPVLNPQLFTPVRPTEENPSGWVGAKMNAHQMPRLYHSTALLLPDGRVWLGGGNAYRAQAVPPPQGEELQQVLALLRGERLGRTERSQLRRYVGLLNERAFPESGMQLALLTDPRYDYVTNQVALYDLDTTKYLQGSSILAEQHHVEVFSPPYMFQDGGRPRIADAPEVISYNESFHLLIENVGEGGMEDFDVILVKPGSVTHSMNKGQRVIPLGIVARNGDRFSVRAPQAPEDRGQGERRFYNHTPGFYMLFFVDKTRASVPQVPGVPSEATWVLLQSQ